MKNKKKEIAKFIIKSLKDNPESWKFANGHSAVDYKEGYINGTLNTAIKLTKNDNTVWFTNHKNIEIIDTKTSKGISLEGINSIIINRILMNRDYVFKQKKQKELENKILLNVSGMTDL